MVDEELRARIINRAKVKLGKMKELPILEAVTLLEYIEELESRPTQHALDVAFWWRCQCGWANDESIKLCNACGTQVRQAVRRLRGAKNVSSKSKVMVSPC